MKAHAALAILLSLAPATSLLAQETQPAEESQPADDATDPATFAEMAVASNMFEIASSQLALELSEDEEVRTFAQRMIDDHTAADERLRTMAGEAGIELTTEVPEAEQEKLDTLAEAEDFDAAYLQAQVEAHDKAVNLFQSFSENGEDGPLRDFAAETLPTLQEHRAMVEDMTSV